MTISELIWGAVGFLLTVMILSYLIGDNVFFKLAASIFIGVTAGYLAVLLIKEILWPYLVQPIITGPWQTRLWMGIPIILIILLILSQFSSLKGLGSIPLAYLAGLSAAIAVGGAVFGTLLPQSRAVIDAFDRGNWSSPSIPAWRILLNALVMLIGTLSTLSFFYFGRKWKSDPDADPTQRPFIFHILGKIGQVFIGITLGAVFAGVFSSALIALIGRISFVSRFITQFFGGN